MYVILSEGMGPGTSKDKRVIHRTRRRRKTDVWYLGVYPDVQMRRSNQNLSLVIILILGKTPQFKYSYTFYTLTTIKGGAEVSLSLLNLTGL